MNCSIAAENTFGPAVAQCRRYFDFTLLFEDVFFCILPTGIFSVSALVRLAFLSRRKSLSKRRGSRYFTTIVLSIFSCLKLALVVLLSIRDDGNKISTSVPAVSIDFAASLLLLVWSYYERRRSSCSHLFISFYLSIMALLQAVRIRTYWLIPHYRGVATVSLAALLVQFVLLVDEELAQGWQSSRKSPLASREVTAGFWNRSLLAWVNPLLWKGYKRPLEEFDLITLDPVLVSSTNAKAYERLSRMKKVSPYLFLAATFRCSGGLTSYPVFSRLLLSGFTFAQPFLATTLIAYLSDSSTSQGDAGHGYGLLGACALVYCGLAISTGWYWSLVYKFVTKVRAGYTNAVTQKLMRIGQQEGTESKMLTLVVADIQRIVNVLAFSHELWAAPLETSIATWLLWRQIGPASLTVLGFALACMGISTYFGALSRKQQAKWLQATEKRISATKAMLSSLKAIKMMGVNQKVAAKIENLRRLEFAASKFYRTLLVGSVFISYSTSILAPVIAFGAYVGITRSSHESFDASKLFGSLILINLLASPLVRLLQIVTQLGSAFGCIARLQEFLEGPEAPGADFLRDISGIAKYDENSQLNRGEQFEMAGMTALAGRTGSSVALYDVDLGCSGRAILKNVNLEILKGENVVITGSVGSGKSMLVQAIIGEIQPQKGRIHIGREQVVRYCSQDPWLENVSAYDNVFRHAPNDPDWRQKVINACAIREILGAAKVGDTVRSGGSKLSGGERQRLALARSVAARPSLLVLDDAFAAIDRITSESIIDKLLGRRGLLRQCGSTIIQITSNVVAIAAADRVFRIAQDGSIMEIVEPTDLDRDPIRREFGNGDVRGEDTNASTPSLGMEAKSAPLVVPKSTEISDRRVYLAYFRTFGLAHTLIFLALGIVFAFSFKFPVVWTKWWAEADTDNTDGDVGYWLGIYAFLSILPLVAIAAWLGHLMLKIVPITGLGLHGKLLSTVLGSTFAHISGIDAGSLINRFNQDLMFVDSRLPLSLLNTVFGLLMCAVQVVLVVLPALYLLAVLPVLAILLTCIQHFYLRTSKKLRQLELESKAGLQSKLSEIYEGIITIRTHSWQDSMYREFHQKFDRTQEPFYLLFIVQTWLQLVLNLVVAGLAISVVGIAVVLRRSTSASSIGLSVLNLVTLGQTLQDFIIPWTTLEISLGSVARIEAFDKDTPQESQELAPTQAPAEWPKRGELKFDHVWATYSVQDKSSSWSLQDVSFEITAGERIAICGRTGSGKSTLLLSLLSLINVANGKITIDGIDIARIPRSVLRSRLLVVPQDPYVDGETARAALSCAGHVEDYILTDVLSDCGLSGKFGNPQDLGRSLSDFKLSAGEKQLFILARTILEAYGTDGGLLLLDEATSGVDAATERKVMKCIRTRLPRTTIISVLHRVEAALEFDRIIVLDRGQLSLIGTPEEVMVNSALFSTVTGLVEKSKCG